MTEARRHLPDPTLPYNGLTLDRAGAKRMDEGWVTELRSRPHTRLIPLWRDRCLLLDRRPISAAMADAAELLAAADEPVFLGLASDTAVFAVDLSTVEEEEALRLAHARESADTRAVFGALNAAEASTVAYARGLLHWHRNQRFCGACGAASAPRHGGHLRMCLGCGKLLFPRIEPAVIVLVTAPGAPSRCLLGRHRGAAEGVFSTLAGFVEIGESLEDAVRREVKEEAGVRIREVSYQASQAWPFPAGLMVGFRAIAASEAIDVDRDELEEARWFTRAELQERLDHYRSQGISRYDSIEKYLLDTWLTQAPAEPGRPTRP